MPEYVNPFTREKTPNRYRNLGSGYEQDLVTGAVRRRTSAYGYRDVEDATEDRYERKWAEARQFNSNLDRYDRETRKWTDEAMRSFREGAEQNAARQTGGVMAGVNQYLQRSGITDTGLGAALATQADAATGGEVSSSVNSFNTKLLTLMHQERDSFLRGEFDFLKRLQIMDHGAELQQKIMQFQADLANDFSFRDAFLGVLNLGGRIISGFTGGGGGGDTSQSSGGEFPGGPAGYEDYGYGRG